VPDSAALDDAAPPPAVTLNVALFAPGEAGLKATLMVQAVPAATAVPQLLLCKNCPAPLPLMAMLVIGSEKEPVLVRVIAWAVLTTPSACVPNAKVVGLMEYTGTAPVPDSDTLCDVEPPPELTLKVALVAPAAVGLNTMLTMQDAPTEMALPQLLV
jgi:hypothetical protein